MKTALATILAALAVLAAGAGRGAALSPAGCVVPRLFGLAPTAAEARLRPAGCRVGVVVFQRPRGAVARVTVQSAAPGALLPAGARVALLVS